MLLEDVRGSANLTFLTLFLVLKKKAPSKTDRGKGIELLFDAALLEDAQGNSEDESDDVHEKDDNDNDSGNDDDGGNDAQDSKQTDSDDDENPSFTLKDYEEEQYEEYVLTLERDKSDDEDKMYEEEDDDVAKELYGDLSITQGLRDIDMTNAKQGGEDKKMLLTSQGLYKKKKMLVSDIQKNLYNALVESYNTDKDILSTYGDVVTLKRGRDDQDKDENPSARSERGTKRRKSTQAKEPKFKATDTKLQQDQGSESGHIDDQPDNEAAPKNDWFQKLDKPLTPDRLRINQNLLTLDHLRNGSAPLPKNVTKKNNLLAHSTNLWVLLLTSHLIKPLPLIEDRRRQVVPAHYFINNDLEYLKGGSSSSKYTTSTTRTKAAKYDNIKGIEDMVPTL
nr:hypothetical protein [Tanacetum cinerariifolium]